VAKTAFRAATRAPFDHQGAPRRRPPVAPRARRATQFGAPPHDDTRRALPELLIWFLLALQHLGARKREQRVVQAVSERIYQSRTPNLTLW
jgi:hypothetical protein